MFFIKKRWLGLCTKMKTKKKTTSPECKNKIPHRGPLRAEVAAPHPDKKSWAFR